jgi:hypothetical protein
MKTVKIADGAVVEKISYVGKEVTKELVVPGLVKTGNAFLVKCSVSGQWTYCNQARLDKLTAKYGSIEKVGTNYVGRAGKKTVKAQTPAPVVPVAPVAE